MTKKDKIRTTVGNLLKTLLEHLKVEAETEIKEDKDGTVKVQIETKDPGILIGHHGETLDALQFLLAMMAYRQSGKWTRILVNVGDYREKREEALARMGLATAQKVKFSGEECPLPSMNPAERRIIHLSLADDKAVVTESEGEGDSRRVVVKPKR